MRACLCLVLASAACGRLEFERRPGAPGDATTDEAATPLRCASLSPICGPSGTASCCASALVPGGSFFRSYDVGTDGNYPEMTAPAIISDFRLDTYEVTVGRFREFIGLGFGTRQQPPPNNAGARMLDGVMQGGWDQSWNAQLQSDTAALVAAVKCSPSWTDAPGAKEALPITCITWYEAMAFCIWDGGFLPTEAEWNYAATGGAEQRAYPWSSPPSSLTVDCSHANFDPGTPCNGAPVRVGNQSPQGDGRWGHADLAGNVIEWALDWYAPYSSSCSDCANLSPTTFRVFRGGSYGFDASLMRTAYRVDVVGQPESRHGDFGVRCARRSN